MRTRPLRCFLSLTTLVFVLATAEMAVADNSKIAPDLQPLLANSANKVDVIVQYSTPPECGGLLGLGGLLCNLPILGGVVKIVFGLINAVTATLSPADIISTSNQSNVTYISPNRVVAASLDYSGEAADAPMAWA